MVAPKPAPAVPSAKISLARRGGGVAEIAVGREAPPVLVAAVEQVEQDGAANDRHCGYRRSQSRGRARAARACTPHRRRGRKPSRRTARRRQCARRCDAAQAGRSRACPARRRARRQRSRPAPSNTMAVTPEASRASSACPTRMPATSVIRFRRGKDHLVASAWSARLEPGRTQTSCDWPSTRFPRGRRWTSESVAGTSHHGE